MDRLIVFMKEDCPTCALTRPLLDVARQRYDVEVVDEDAGEDALRRSFAASVDTVPTVVTPDGGRFVGFDRARWRELLGEEVDWEQYPASRPGCGSKTQEPAIAERLAAEASGSPLRARRIEIGQGDDPFEFLFAQGLTDGLPVVPPTPERVLRMLHGTRRDPQEVIARVPPTIGEATVEKIAINAVMAGCRPEYLPVVIAAVQAACTDSFNIHGVLATTHFVGPVVIVNGPVRDRIGLNYGVNALGQGNRANATIGRALQLVVRNVGGGRPGEIDRAALGQPGKYTFCFAEHEARSNWDPLHVERGFRAEVSTVTLYAGCAPTAIVDQLARDAAGLATSYAAALDVASNPRQRGYGEVVFVVPPEHVDTIAKDGWSKQRFREAIHAATVNPTPKCRSAELIHLVVAGGEAGKFAALIDNWAGGGGSAMTTVRIEE